MKNCKRTALIVSFAIVSFLAFCFSALFLEASAKTQGGVFDIEFSFSENYAVGETVDIPYATYTFGKTKTDCRFSLVYQGNGYSEIKLTGDSAKGMSYVLDEQGTWFVVYEAENAEKMSSKSFSFTVGERNFIEIEDADTVVAFGSKGIIPKGWYVDGDGKKYECDVTAECPDGSSLKSGEDFEFLQVGLYKYSYSYLKGGQKIEKVKYIKCTLSYENLFYGSGLVSATPNSLPGKWSKQNNGVLLVGARGGTVKYRNAINLLAVDKTKNIVQFQILRDDGDQFYEMDIVLTDKYDANNSITVKYIHAGYDEAMWWIIPVSYMEAGVSNGKLFGYESGNVNFYPYGSVIRNSFYGADGYKYNSGSKLEYFNFQLDYENGKIYTRTKDGAVGSSTLVCDLYDTETSGVEWNGFTTGEVYMEFRFTDKAFAPKILVSEICGVSLSGDTVKDNVSPFITGSTDLEYGDTLPDAVVGSNYPIPTANANDILNGNCRVSTKVLYNSQTVFTGSDNFVPTQAGSYQIVYTATDAFGNIATKTLNFEAKNKLDAVAGKFSDESPLFVGEEFILPNVVLSGGSGNLSIVNSKVLLNGNEINKNGEYYVAQEAGVLTVELDIKDYIGTHRLELSLNVVASDLPTTVIKNIPISAIKGQTIVFPDYQAIDYKNGKDCYKTIYVNGERLGGNRTYTVKSTDSALYVEYITRAGVSEKVDSFNVAVRDSAKVEDAVFSKSSIQKTLDGSNGLKCTSNGNFAIYAANALFIEDFSFEFKALLDSSSSLKVVLSDYATKNNEISLLFSAKDNKSSYLTINGGKFRYTVNGSLLSSDTTFALSVSNGTLFVGGEEIVSLSEYSNGVDYDGFGDGKVILCVEGVNVAETANVWFYRLANQSFISIGQFFSDSGPQVVYSEKMRNKTVSVNERVSVASARAIDVIMGEREVFCSVYSPSNRPIYENVKCDSTYSFLASEYGEYTVKYVSTDGSGNDFEEVYTITVIDNIAPVISVGGTFNETYKVGEKVTIFSAVATDAMDGGVKVIVYVADPDNAYHAVNIGSQYKFSTKGVYRIVYLAYDSQMNCARQEFLITVG